TLPGWKRFEGAEQWLANYREQVVANRRQQFDQFLADRPAGRPLGEQDRNQLFEEFLKWSQARERRECALESRSAKSTPLSACRGDQCSRNSPLMARISAGRIRREWATVTECNGPSSVSCQNARKR